MMFAKVLEMHACISKSKPHLTEPRETPTAAIKPWVFVTCDRRDDGEMISQIRIGCLFHHLKAETQGLESFWSHLLGGMCCGVLRIRSSHSSQVSMDLLRRRQNMSAWAPFMPSVRRVVHRVADGT